MMNKTALLALGLFLVLGAHAAPPKYDRDLFPHWSDLDDDCQDTRTEILLKYNKGTIVFDEDDECEEVISGSWKDPYSEKVHTKAKELDVDHVIALQFAHISGAHAWTEDKREQFANDMELNVIPVSLKLNRQKGAKPPSKWMPPAASYHCEYLTRWSKVQAKYKLNIAKAEMDFIRTKMAQVCKKKAPGPAVQ